MRYQFLFIFLYSAFSSQLIAQYTKPSHLSVMQGLPSETVRCLFKDSKDRLWIGMDGGVSCYTGSELKNYSSVDGLAGDMIWSIDEDEKGNIWFGCYGSGISKFDGVSFESFMLDGGNEVPSIRRIFCAQDGSVFGGTDVGLFRMKPDGTIVTFSKKLNNTDKKRQGAGFYQLDKDSVLYITIDPNNCIYVLSQDTIYDLPENHKYKEARGYIAKEIDGELVVAGGNIKIYKKDSCITKRLTDYGLNGPVWDVTSDGLGNYYMPAFGGGAYRDFGGVYKFDGEDFIDYSNKLKVIGTNYWSILYDRELGILQMGSLESGLYSLKSELVNYFDLSHEFEEGLDHLVDSNNDTWLFDENKVIKIEGLDTINFTNQIKEELWLWDYLYYKYRVQIFGDKLGSFTSCDKYLKDHNLNFRNLYGDGEAEKAPGTLYNPEWSSKQEAIIKKGGGTWKDNFLLEFSIIDLTEDSKNNIWVSTSKGLVKIGRTQLEGFRIPCGRTYIDSLNQLWTSPQYRSMVKVNNLDDPWKYIDFNHSIDNSAVDIEGAIALGNDLIFISWNSGLFVYNYQKDQFTRYLVNNSNFPSNQYKTFEKVSDSTFLVLYENGNVSMVGNTGDTLKILNTLNSKENFYKARIFDVKVLKNDIWFTSNIGLLRICVDDFIAGEVNASWYNHEEGIVFNAKSLFSDDALDSLVILSLGELVSIKAEEFIERFDQISNFNIQSIYVNKIAVNNRIREGVIELAYDENNISIELEIKNFLNPSKDQFRYRLDKSPLSWSDWQTASIISFDKLGYGTYYLDIEYRNLVNPVQLRKLSLQIIIHPPWWKSNLFYLLMICFIILVMIVLYKLRTRKILKNQKRLQMKVQIATKEIRHQKEEIEEAHKEIKDSIDYAERIQRSFLATKEILDNNLEDYFVFFKPKDVVSGDFYWAGILSNGNFAIVNADSTGHGVPGAIMSILNISSIENAVNSGVSDPAAIFNTARVSIIDRLKKDGSPEGGKDGMDASILSFNTQRSIMTYTAAQNPIWIIRAGEMIQIRPEKMPVGKHDKDNVPFKGGEFELQKGDQIYTITDGFQDQFGGEKGKKFMVKNMREYILSIAHLSMEDQHKELSKMFNIWRGDFEQVDDVCVIGIRV